MRIKPNKRAYLIVPLFIIIGVVVTLLLIKGNNKLLAEDLKLIPTDMSETITLKEGDMFYLYSAPEVEVSSIRIIDGWLMVVSNQGTHQIGVQYMEGTTDIYFQFTDIEGNKVSGIDEEVIGYLTVESETSFKIMIYSPDFYDDDTNDNLFYYSENSNKLIKAMKGKAIVSISLTIVLSFGSFIFIYKSRSKGLTALQNRLYLQKQAELKGEAYVEIEPVIKTTTGIGIKEF